MVLAQQHESGLGCRMMLSAPITAHLELTAQCNNRCSFCYNQLHYFDSSPELSTAEVQRILTELCSAGVQSCNITGGEPCLRKDLPEILSCCNEMHFCWSLTSNGTALTEELADILKTCPGGICLSLLSSSEGKHDALTGRPGSWREALRGMDLLADKSISFAVNICASSSNYGDVFDTARLCANRGCRQISLTRCLTKARNLNNFRLNDEMLLSALIQMRRIEEEIDEIDTVLLADPLPICGVPDEFKEKVRTWNILCDVGVSVCRIGSTGKLTPCNLIPAVMADLRQVSFQEGWKSSAWNPYRGLDHIGTICGGCALLDACRGGCPAHILQGGHDD